MFVFEKDCKRYLYHYTTAQVALNYILKDRTLKVSRLTNTNDPKEYKSWLFELGTNFNTDLNQFNMSELSKKVGNLIQTRTFLICFSKDQVLTGDHLLDLPKRGYGHSRMWAQYANNHTGICLVFDFEKLSNTFHDCFQDKTYNSENVKYIDRFIGQRDSAFIINVDSLCEMGAEEYALNHAQTYKERLFFEKAKDWENEQEYRWVLQDSISTSEPVFAFNDALRGIVFGANCDEKNIKSIIDLTCDLDLEYHQLKWRNCSPWYNFERQL